MTSNGDCQPSFAYVRSKYRRVGRPVPTHSGRFSPMPQTNPTASSSILRASINFGCAVLLALTIWGCSTQSENLAPAIAPPPPPVVAIPHPAVPTKITTASWYGPGLEGHPTSTGEPYNQHALTAASRTLPIGSHAKVTNLKTGKSVVVRINDHGPYVHGRGIDLSRAAAKRIGIDHHGTAKVAVTRVDRAEDEEDSHPRTETTKAHPSDGGMPPVMESSMIPTSMGSSSSKTSSSSR